MRIRLFAIAAIAFASTTGAHATSPIAIVAAENVYGTLARDIAGPDATVTSILSNPDQDPHLFEADAATARALSAARIVIVNGADYDPWMDKLLAASTGKDRITINVAHLLGKMSGDNPHLWYDPTTMTRLAGMLDADLSAIDPAHTADYAARTAAFVAGLQPLQAKVADIRAHFGGQPVTASEPVFGYMASALGLDMRNQGFQTAVMNNTEPSPRDVAAFEDDLRHHKVKVMLYNSQADDEAVKRLVGIAREAGVPVVGVSETEPAGTSYEAWMLDQLTALQKALASGNS